MHEHDVSIFGDGFTRRSAASRSARFRRRAPPRGGRLACRAIAPYHVVKMRDTRSLRVFNENYPLSRSFSLRVVGATPPHPRAIVLFLSQALILSRNCAEKFWGCAQQIFRALDNDVKLKSKHARSGLLPRALIAL